MKRIIVLSLFIVLLASMSAMAATTATGTLSVTATVVGSVNLVFNSDASGVTLTGAGTNAATLPFGSVQAFGGVVPTGVTRTVAASSFTVSSPVDVYVTKNNSTSLTYSLTAALGVADAVNTWTVNAVTLTTTAAPITATGAYAGTGAQTVGLQIPFTNNAASISNSIVFVATAN
jgi:hypothetical protein